nr:unnamed protein product [Digitaria exilis]
MSTRGGGGGRRGGRGDQGGGRGGGGGGGAPGGQSGRTADLGSGGHHASAASGGGGGRGDRGGATVQRGGHFQPPVQPAAAAGRGGGYAGVAQGRGQQQATALAQGPTQRGGHPFQPPHPAAGTGRGGYPAVAQGRGQQVAVPTPAEVEALRRQVERKAVVSPAPLGMRGGPSPFPGHGQAPPPASGLAPATPARPQMQAKATGQVAVPTPGPAGSSSSSARAPAPGETPPPAARVEIMQGKAPGQATQMAMATPAGSLPPVSSKAVVLASRPGYGTVGRRCRVRANHAQVYLDAKDIYHYDVVITPESASRARNRWIIKELVELHKQYLGGRLPVYDGRKSLFTAGPLPFKDREFVLMLTNPERANLGTKEYKVAIKDAAKLDMYSLQQFLAGRQREMPQEIIQALDIALREYPASSISSISDISATAFYKSQPIVDFVVEYLNIRDTSKRLSDQERIKLKKALKGVRVETTHRRDMSIRYKITGLTSTPLNDLMYFIYYIAVCVCNIAKGQRYSSKLNEHQVRNILTLACERPADRERRTSQVLENNNYAADDYAKEFGIKVNHQLTLVDARVLPAPKLKYHDSGKETTCNPSIGQWNMINKKMVNGGSIKYWACLTFTSRIHPNEIGRFCEDLAMMCNSIGMQMSSQPCIQIKKAHHGNVEAAIRGIHGESVQVLSQQGLTGQQLELLIIILPDMSGSYGMIKRLCETELGLITQCCAPRNIMKGGKQLLENLALKINAKVGGRNTVLEDALNRRIPLLTDVPTIIFGADVTHPSPGEASSPSIAAVVASMDWPQVTKYKCLVSSQGHRVEIIDALFTEVRDPVKGLVRGGMIRDLLISFRKSTGLRRERIIFYRDGVSEGQFSQVLLYEMDAIRKACASLEEGYLPRVTFVVVQKRHHTRLFPENHRARDQTDKSGNILPGTVVDTKICHPSEFNFYLCSHSGIKGTSRPAHYHVLIDENGFTADALQTLTYNLCYTYARCTRSVSIVPPAYYAHLGAFRARYYLEDDNSDQGSSTGTSRTHDQSVPVKQLPRIKENVQKFMFYC